MKKTCAGALIFVYLMTMLAFPANAVGTDPNMNIRIGLEYASNGEVSYNIFYENGFYYGYTSEDASTFTQVYADNSRFICVAQNETLYYDGSSLTKEESGTCIGPYHVQIEQAFGTKEEADAFLQDISSWGVPSPFVAYTGGVLKVRYGAYQTQAAACDAQSLAAAYSSSVTGENENTFTVVDMNTGSIIFEYTDDSGLGFTVSAKQVGERPELKHGSRYYYGNFEFKMNTDYENITLINVIDLQTYLKCVVPSEMTSSWPVEALKAQAVAARSYAVANLNKHAKYGFSLCASSDCQVYYGTSKMADQSNQAVEDTYGIVATYEGEVVTLFYHSSSGGYTEPTENVWVTSIPYIVSVTTPYEDLENATYGLWTYDVTPSELTSYFQEKGYDISDIVDVYVDQFTPSGNVYRVVLVDKNGCQLAFEKDKMRIRLNQYVKSLCFTISSKFNMAVNDEIVAFAPNNAKVLRSANSEVCVDTTPSNLSDLAVLTSDGIKQIERPDDYTFVFDGRGWGNNVGMSQQSAKGMAKNGYTYDQILSHFFPGTVLESMN